MVQASPGIKVTSYLKKKKKKKPTTKNKTMKKGLVECLPSKHETLSLAPSTAKVKEI
jgi:hypothetical protein